MKITGCVAAALLIAGFSASGVALGQDFDPDYLGTYSIIGMDPTTGEMGMAVQSKAFAVGYRTWDAKGGLGVIAHQAASNPMYGQIGLKLLSQGMAPKDALDMMVRADELSSRRQVAILDAQGRTAAFTGADASDWKGHKCGNHYCAQGNTLAGPEVVNELARVFETTSAQPLADRLMSALDAAQAAGGDVRGMQSAAMIIVKPLAGAAGFSDVVMDIRVNDHRTPLVELRRLLRLFQSGEMITSANTTFAQDRDKGVTMALAARDRSPENDNAWVALASMYVKLNRVPDALAAVAKAIELNPANKRQIPKNRNFDSLRNDPTFLKLVQ